MTTTPMGPREVARTTGVSTDTLRHYERKGLLPGVRANLLETLGTRAVIEGTRRRRQNHSGGSDVPARATKSLGQHVTRPGSRR
jgi:MerR family regulatory protein